MTKRDLLLREIEGVPDEVIEEVIDFLRFLQTKSAKKNMQTAYASEHVLADDWLKEEEEEAWHDL